jgi:peptidyl-prolyl cis-trans isomerase D
MGNNFVIATLTGATEEGTATFASVKDRVELAVQKEKKSKLLVERIKNAASGKSDMYAIASALGTQVSIASAINFNTVSIPEYGMEPAVVGTAVSMQPNVVSAPIEGNNGVYVLKVTSVEELGDTNVDSEKQRLAQSLGYRASMQTFDITQKAVRIVDKRAKFY